MGLRGAGGDGSLQHGPATSSARNEYEVRHGDSEPARLVDEVMASHDRNWPAKRAPPHGVLFLCEWNTQMSLFLRLRCGAHDQNVGMIDLTGTDLDYLRLSSRIPAYKCTCRFPRSGELADRPRRYPKPEMEVAGCCGRSVRRPRAGFL